jgi:hypothetical protein
MKRFVPHMVVTAVCLVMSNAAWSQQRDLEVTMDVVPANASTGGAGEIKLPLVLPEGASERGREASSFGLGTGSKAAEMQGDVGRDFGKEVSETAKQKSHDPNLPSKSRRP